MKTDDPNKMLDIIKHFQKATLIVSVVYGIVVITYCALLSLTRISDFLSAILFWPLMVFGFTFFCLQLIPVILLILSPDLRQLHLAIRMNTIFLYITYLWIVLFSGLLLYEVKEGTRGLFFVMIPFFICGIILAVIFWIFHRKYTKKFETVFP